MPNSRFGMGCTVGNCGQWFESYREILDHLTGTHHMSIPQAKHELYTHD